MVTDNGQVAGCVSTADVKRIPREEWEQHTVQEVGKPSSESNTIGPDTDALQALGKMRDAGATGLLVTDHGRLLAIVSLKAPDTFVLPLPLHVWLVAPAGSESLTATLVAALGPALLTTTV